MDPCLRAFAWAGRTTPEQLPQPGAPDLGRRDVARLDGQDLDGCAAALELRRPLEVVAGSGGDEQVGTVEDALPVVPERELLEGVRAEHEAKARSRGIEAAQHVERV